MEADFQDMPAGKFDPGANMEIVVYTQAIDDIDLFNKFHRFESWQDTT